MWWKRCFNHSHSVPSNFRLVGSWPDGLWIENTAPLELTSTVAVVEGGWYWHVVGARLRGVPLPLSLMPRVTAYKRIEGGKYRFHAGFALPVFGEVFSRVRQRVRCRWRRGNLRRVDFLTRVPPHFACLWLAWAQLCRQDAHSPLSFGGGVARRSMRRHCQTRYLHRGSSICDSGLRQLRRYRQQCGTG